MSIKKIYNDLMDLYYNYYWCVYYEIVQEAITNTLKDLKNDNDLTIEKIHKHIKENYI